MDITTSYGYRVRVGDIVGDSLLKCYLGRAMTSAPDGRGGSTHTCGCCRCSVTVNKDGRVIEIRY